MKNSNYWKKRFKQLEAASFQKGVEYYQVLDNQYIVAQNQIEKEIRSWYQRFAVNNNVSIAEAKKMLSKQELMELKWTVNDYIKYGEENSIDGMFIKQLENASAKYHISRLEALKLNTQGVIEKLYGNQTDEITDLIKNVYNDNMFHTMYELQKGFGIGWNFSGIDEKKLEKLISIPWTVDGTNFSDRIWQNKKKLLNELSNELTSMCLTGKSPNEAIKNISKKMNVSKSRAKSIVYTETSHFQSLSDRDTLKEFGCERYEILATLDSHTSEICREMDGKVFDLNDYEVGVSAPPFHPYCRTVIVPSFEDDFDVSERAARDEETGKTYFIPEDIKYHEWEEAFVKGNHEGYIEFSKNGKNHFVKPKPKNNLVNIDINDTIKVEREILDIENFPNAFTSKHEVKNTQTMIDYINKLENADGKVLKLYNSMGKMENIETQGIPFKITHGKNNALSLTYNSYSKEIVDVKLNIPKLTGDNLSGQIGTTLHEEMHYIDFMNRKDTKTYSSYFSTQQKGLVDIVAKKNDYVGEEATKIFNQFKDEYKNISNKLYQEYQTKINELTDDYVSKFGTARGSSFTLPTQKYKELNKLTKKLRTERDSMIDYEIRNAIGGNIGNLQDIYDALSGGSLRDRGKVLFGHGSRYYMSIDSRVQEIVANYASLSITRPDLIEILKKDYPQLVDELDKYVDELLKKVGV